MNSARDGKVNLFSSFNYCNLDHLHLEISKPCLIRFNEYILMIEDTLYASCFKNLFLIK